MPRGKSWTLTDRRRDEVVRMLMAQHSLTSIAHHFGINYETLRRKVAEEGIDINEVKLMGIASLRAKLYNTIDDIDDPVDKMREGLRYLKQYDKEQVMTENPMSVTIKSDREIASEIANELSSGVGSIEIVDRDEDT